MVLLLFSYVRTASIIPSFLVLFCSYYKNFDEKSLNFLFFMATFEKKFFLTKNVFYKRFSSKKILKILFSFFFKKYSFFVAFFKKC